MGNFLAVLKVVMTLLPILGQLVQSVEAAVPQGSQGAQKLAMVRGMLENAFQQMQGISVSFSMVWPLIEPVIASLVAIYKSTGVFQTSPAQPTAAPATE